MNLTCIIIDDEEHSISLLSSYVDEVPDLRLTKSTTNIMDALSYLDTEHPDIIFLDINMPKISGIEFLKIIRARQIQSYVILITAYPEFALQGYELEVFDYLVKPIPFDRFLKAIHKVHQLSRKIRNAKKEPESYFFVKVDSKNKTVKINISEIIYIQGLKNYVSIFTTQGRVVTMLNMKDIEDYLTPYKFIRVHRSYIISANKISKIDGNRVFLTSDNQEIPIGDSYKTDFNKFLIENSLKL